MERIPKNILKAPPTYLDENMIAYFKLAGYSGVPVWTNMGCAFFVYMDARTIHRCRYAVHSVKLELHVVDGCPLIWLDVKVYDRKDDPLHFDGFLNITREDQDHLPAIEALTEQEIMAFHWYDEQLQYVRSTALRWHSEQRESAKEIIKLARAVVAETGGGDFDQAKAKYIRENPFS